VAPSPSAATVGGLVISEAEIVRHLDALAEIADQNGGIRAAGTAGYDASAAYVVDQLTDLGYDVAAAPFEFDFFDEAAPVELAVGEQSWAGADWIHAMLYSAPGDVSAEVQPVSLVGDLATGTGGCEAADWSGFSAGRIALVGSGPCFRRDQVINAQNAGAVAIISLHPRWELGQTRRPTLFDPAGVRIPAISVGQQPTAALLAAAASGAETRISVQTIAEPRTDNNVIAELAGTTDEIVFLGGHLDSVLDGPGVNDNASGVAALLALAEALNNEPQPAATIRFGFWGAEEFGDLGSQAYVSALPAAELQRIRAYLNLDMVASPNAARFVYDNELTTDGSFRLTRLLMDAFNGLGAPAERFDAGPSSDHFAFVLAGVPIGGVFSGLAPLSDEQAALFGGVAGLPADWCYHLACDVRENANSATALLFTQAVAIVLEELAF
jgi:hypothetical protein